ncbi:MAG: DALR anticodon-binding domain-containing protein, partial [Succinivibrio dextrinosolvens]|nr:DALR anticodon-binding domain-containing protein [Succinivibrio dextrinosolvens]
AENLASAYKRINNILSKADNFDKNINESLLKEDAEVKLFNVLKNVDVKVSKLYSDSNYTEALSALSELKDPVDNFFENVMVNAEDVNIKNNRLALLNNLHEIIAKTADISVLF